MDPEQIFTRIGRLAEKAERLRRDIEARRDHDPAHIRELRRLQAEMAELNAHIPALPTAGRASPSRRRRDP